MGEDFEQKFHLKGKDSAMGLSLTLGTGSSRCEAQPRSGTSLVYWSNREAI